MLREIMKLSLLENQRDNGQIKGVKKQIQEMSKKEKTIARDAHIHVQEKIELQGLKVK
jgi:hypothetical protein